MIASIWSDAEWGPPGGVPLSGHNVHFCAHFMYSHNVLIWLSSEK
jgi:hypothetical protein